MRPVAGSAIVPVVDEPSRRAWPRVSVVLTVLLVGLGCASSTDESSRPAAPLYSVDGGFLRDRHGRVIVLRGINLPNDYDQRGPEKEVRPPPEVFQHIAESGFNAVRLVIEW